MAYMAYRCTTLAGYSQKGGQRQKQQKHKQKQKQKQEQEQEQG